MRRGTIRDDAVRFIKNREDFECSQLSGHNWPAGVAPLANSYWSWLPEAWRERYILDRPTYVVFSFNTPIAWVAEDGREVVPPVKYSVRTTMHQSKVYQAMQTVSYWKLREPAPYEVAA